MVSKLIMCLLSLHSTLTVLYVICLQILITVNIFIKFIIFQIKSAHITDLKCYYQIVRGGSAKNCGYFELIWWQTDKKINPEAELQGPVYLGRTVCQLFDYQIQ